MNWLCTFLRSSIGRKVVMAATGLLLIGFVVAHLAGNLLLYVGADAFNGYAEALHKNQALIYVAEVGLVALFFSHIYLAVVLTMEQRKARGVQYEVRESKQGKSKITASAVMHWSGVIVLGFVILHLADFRFGLRGNTEGMEPFERAITLLRDPLTCWVYIIGTLLLSYHLNHGFQSMFQSLGLRHPKYTPIIKKAGLVVSLVIGLGFASIPVWANFIYSAS